MRTIHGRTPPNLTNPSGNSISIIRLLEKSANGNGGARLTYEFFAEDRRWHSYLPHEQKLIAATSREFKRALIREGFLVDL